MKFYLLILLPVAALLATACNTHRTEKAPSFVTLSDTAHEAVSPQAFVAPDRSVIAWWIEKDPDDEQNIVAFSRYDKATGTFRRRTYIAATSGCNDGHGQGMPVMLQKKDGTLLAVYHKRIPTEEHPFAGKVFYVQSFDRGDSWTNPQLLHQDTLPDNSHGFPALTLLPDGEAAAIWLDGRNHLPYSELFMAKTIGKEGFKKEKKIGGPTCQCCKLDFYTDKNNIVHVLYRGISGDNIRDIMHITSADGGETFSAPETISDDGWKINGCPHAGPDMACYSDSLYYVWYTMGGGQGIFYCSSDLKGNSFSKRVNLAGNSLAKYPQITVLPDDALAIVWQEYQKGDSKGYNLIRLQTIKEARTKLISLSEPGEDATHPFLASVNRNTYLFYEKQVNGKTVAGYKLLELK